MVVGFCGSPKGYSFGLSLVSTILPNNVEMLILIGGDHQTGTGNNLNNGLFSYSDNASLQFDNTITQAKIMGQANSNTTIEQLRLSDGSFLTNAD